MRNILVYSLLDVALFFALYAAIGQPVIVWRAIVIGVVVAMFQQLGTVRQWYEKGIPGASSPPPPSETEKEGDPRVGGECDAPTTGSTAQSANWCAPTLPTKMHVLVAEIRRCIDTDRMLNAYRKLDVLDALICEGAALHDRGWLHDVVQALPVYRMDGIVDGQPFSYVLVRRYQVQRAIAAGPRPDAKFAVVPGSEAHPDGLRAEDSDALSDLSVAPRPQDETTG